MAEKTRNEGKQYLRELRRKLFPLPRKMRKDLKKLTSDVKIYVALHPDCTRATLVETYGNPEQIPYANTGKEELDRLVRREFIHRLCIVLCVLLAMVVIYFSLVLADIYKNQKNYSTFRYNDVTGEADRIVGGPPENGQPERVSAPESGDAGTP